MMSEERVPVHVFYGMRFRLLQGGRKNTTISSMKQLSMVLVRFFFIFLCTNNIPLPSAEHTDY
jgi:hypothetical protein